MTWLEIISVLILIDSTGALLFAWRGRKWYTEHFESLTEYFPMAKGWVIYYFILALFIAWLVWV